MTESLQEKLKHPITKSEDVRDERLKFLESKAISKSPKNGKCITSCFKIGWHRTGIVQMKYSNPSKSDEYLSQPDMDGLAETICLECGKVFRKKWFIPRGGRK